MLIVPLIGYQLFIGMQIMFWSRKIRHSNFIFPALKKYSKKNEMDRPDPQVDKAHCQLWYKG